MEKKRVLMIDNDHFSLSVLYRLLSEMGYQPMIGSTERAVDALLEGETPDVIIYNRDLETEWGYSLLERLNRSERTADVPVILLTQSVQRFSPRVEGDRETAVCFQKPVAIEPFLTLFLRLINEAPPTRPAVHAKR